MFSKLMHFIRDYENKNISSTNNYEQVIFSPFENKKQNLGKHFKVLIKESFKVLTVVL